MRVLTNPTDERVTIVLISADHERTEKTLEPGDSLKVKGGVQYPGVVTVVEK